MTRASGLVAAIVIAGALAGCSTPRTGPSPAPTSLASPAATSLASPAPVTPAPSAACGGATAIGYGTHMAGQTKAGVTYCSNYFKPLFTVRPGANWWVQNNIETFATFEQGPNEPGPPPEYLVQLDRPIEVVLPGKSGLVLAPRNILAWLRARPDLVMSAPTAVTVAGIQGSMIEGGLRAGAALNPEGIVNLICGELEECGYEGGQLIAAAPSRFKEFVDLEVRGAQVIIALSGPDSDRSATQAVFDAFLSTLAFPAS